MSWLLPGAVLLLAGLAWALSRRRQRGLLVHDRDADDGVWYELFAFPVTIGGAAGNDLVLPDPLVSRNHATLERRGRTVELVDLNSENGTFVNGERISRRALADGDRLSFGRNVHLIYEARG
jgi:pSer/pThr/pTyr-binding forkhead associated (FHA) protein